MEFSKALQMDDSNFESILDIMKLRRNPKEVNGVRNLLKITNHILDFFMNRDEPQLKIPVVFFPFCLEYAQELCEDFVTLKLGLYSSKTWKSHLCNRLSNVTLFIPDNVKTEKQYKLLKDNFQFEKTMASILSRSRDEYVDYGNSLIYSERLQKEFLSYNKSNTRFSSSSVNKYWYLHCAINGSIDFARNRCPLSIINTDVQSFYDSITEDNKYHTEIHNIIVFPSKSADGRYSEFCAELFQQCFLDDIVSSGCGLKNVLFFCFSRKPYKLRRLFNFDIRMKDKLQISNEGLYDFISFTYEEALSLCNHPKNNAKTYYLGRDFNDLQGDYESLFDDLTNGLDRCVSRRNEMSLFVNYDKTSKFYNQLLAETEADENILNQVLQFNLKLWKDDIEDDLLNFVNGQSVYVVTGNDINKEIKSNFSSLLQKQYQAISVKFGTFSDLKGYIVKGVYRNKIKQQRILVMSFKNDYTDSIFNKYPNSFDPFFINPEQSLMHIVNYFYLRQYYDWGNYNYAKAIKKILKSDFRSDQMKPRLIVYKRPFKRIIEDAHELDDDKNSTPAVQKIKVFLENDTQHEFYKSELMLCRVGSYLKILPISDLVELFESVKDISIQPLNPLIRRVYNYCIDAGREIDSRSERMFKEQELYGLNQDEIESHTQLWKILLAKRVKAYGSEAVYNDIMSKIDERFRVSYHSFERWIDPDYGIPRAKRVQRFLIEQYLGIRPPYINLIRRIKERTKNDTGEITIIIKHFLNLALLNHNYNDVFSALSDETKDLLGIITPRDIERIITELNDKIRFEPLKSMNYDN